MQKVATDTTDGQSVKFRISSWRDEREIRLDFPQGWGLTECLMAGHDLPPLSDSQIQNALENPIGTPRIRDLAWGKEKAVILSQVFEKNENNQRDRGFGNKPPASVIGKAFQPKF